LEFVEKEKSTLDILVSVFISVINEDVKVSIEVAYFSDVDDDDGNTEYPFEFDVSSIVFSIVMLFVLKILSFVSVIK
jgi:hypothetical protein